ncbi:LOW QUALITY PROTEIN: cationic amino acid transporter 2-like [Porphyrio hochstetteri]
MAPASSMGLTLLVTPLSAIPAAPQALAPPQPQHGCCTELGSPCKASPELGRLQASAALPHCPSPLLLAGETPCNATLRLGAGLLGSMFPMPRILYAMARDRLLFKPLAKVSCCQCPVVATLVSGGVAALLALLFNLLVDMMSISTLLGWWLAVCCCSGISLDAALEMFLWRSPWPGSSGGTISSSHPMLLCCRGLGSDSSTLVCALSWVSSARLLCLTGGAWCIAALALPLLGILAAALLLWRQPQSQEGASFMVPCLPFLLLLSITINSILMAQLSVAAWLQYLLWMAIGKPGHP